MDYEIFPFMRNAGFKPATYQLRVGRFHMESNLDISSRCYIIFSVNFHGTLLQRNLNFQSHKDGNS